MRRYRPTADPSRLGSQKGKGNYAPLQGIRRTAYIHASETAETWLACSQCYFIQPGRASLITTGDHVPSSSIWRTIKRLLPWSPLIVPCIGISLILTVMISMLTASGVSPTWPYSGSAPPISGGLPFLMSPTNSGTALREIYRARSALPILYIETSSIDIPSRTISLNLSLSLSTSTIAHLRMAVSNQSKSVPLTTVPRRSWAQFQVEITLGPCLPYLSSPDCGTTVTVSLGRLISPDGTPADDAVSIPVSTVVPVDGSPARYPADSYIARITPSIIFDNPVSLDAAAARKSNGKCYVPPVVFISTSPGSSIPDNYSVTVIAESATKPMIVALIINRPVYYEITVYIAATLPLLLAIVLALAWTGDEGRSSFNPAFVAGLIAAMLAILPLRAVLVPPDLGSDSLTAVDDILLLGVMFIAAFTFRQYAITVTRKGRKDN
jgi:hypothetical protein